MEWRLQECRAIFSWTKISIKIIKQKNNKIASACFSIFLFFCHSEAQFYTHNFSGQAATNNRHVMLSR